MQSDMVTIGQGGIGPRIAYYTARIRPAGDVSGVEHDSNGESRRLFSLHENIETASYSPAFCRDFADTIAVGSEDADDGFRCQDDVFTSDAVSAAQRERNFSLQEHLKVEVELHFPGALSTRSPSISTQEADLSVLTGHDEWIGPHAAFMGFRRKAYALGVRCLAGEASRLDTDFPPGRKCTSVVADVGVDERRGAACA